MEPAAPRTTDWLNRFFDAYYARRPVNATFIGVHEHDSRLPDFSPEGAGDTLAQMRCLLQESRDLDEEPCSPLQEMDRRLAEGFLRLQAWEYQSHHFHRGNPCVYTGEAAFGVMSLFLSDFAPVADRFGAAIERLEAVPALLSQGRANVREAPLAWTERALGECEGALAFLSDGVECLLEGAPKESDMLRRAASRAAAAFREFQSYLDLHLRHRDHQRHGAGEEALAAYLRDGHQVELSGEEIAETAEAEIEELEQRVQERATALGFRDAAAATAALAELHPTTATYYSRFREVWDEIRGIADSNQLLTWPDFPIRYVPRPRWARLSAPHLYFLFYRSPAAFNRPAVHEYLVTPIDHDMPTRRQRELLRANSDSDIKLNHVIHHGGIGHHVQNWHAFRSPSRVGRVAAVDCASRIAMFCGGSMAEGWACYATDLMNEMGALTPLEQLSEQRSRIRMCARAVVDVRLHHGVWSLEQAAAYYQERAGMERGAGRAEAVKNSMFPGAALMYRLGTDGIHRLRGEMSELLGSEFELRRFHDEFLSYGSVPVSLIAAEMKRKHTHA